MRGVEKYLVISLSLLPPLSFIPYHMVLSHPIPMATTILVTFALFNVPLACTYMPPNAIANPTSASSSHLHCIPPFYLYKNPHPSYLFMDITSNNKSLNSTSYSWDLSDMGNHLFLHHHQPPTKPQPSLPPPTSTPPFENSYHPTAFHDEPTLDVEDEHNELGAMKEMIYKIAAMQPVDIDPTTIKKPRRRNVRISEDPQSVAARHRRERISERIRILQRLVPGGTKMDTASMLDEAIRYVKFLKRQVQQLQAKPPPPINVAFATINPTTTGFRFVSDGHGSSSMG